MSDIMKNQDILKPEYTKAIADIKNAVLRSRYKAASLANRELLLLYFGIGEYISENTRNKHWGTGAIEIISNSLQQELPGLRGFSSTNLKNMRIFYEEWKDYLPVNSLITPIGSIERDSDPQNRQIPTAEIKNENISIRQLATAELKNDVIEIFFKVGFTLHREILRYCNTIEERLFYLEQSAKGFWNIEKLKYNIEANLYDQRGKLQSNFKKTIDNDAFRSKATTSFKDELFIDFININDPDDEIDERVIEQSIVNNIKKFIMAIGNEFCFMGNQYRLIIDEDEFLLICYFLIENCNP
jgi:predicted nuclease of restriction endonuclease-like (RecB) superfamily